MNTDNSCKHSVAVPGIYVTTFLAGLVTMSLEMVIGRSFTPYFGGTIFTWGALISVFLLGMAVGYAVGGHLADAFPGRKSLLTIFLLAAIPVGSFPLIGDPVINAILDRVEDVRYAALLAAFTLAFIPVALLAAISPLCVRLILKSALRSGVLSGRLSAINTVGCIVGTLGTSFYLIPNMGIKAIFFLLFGVCILAAAVVILFESRDVAAPVESEAVA